MESCCRLRFWVRSCGNRMGPRPTEKRSRVLRAAGLHGAAWETGRARGTLRQPHRGSLRTSRNYQCRLLDSTRERPGTRYQRSKHIHLYARLSLERRARQAPAAHDDPEFDEVVTRQERNPETRLIIKAHN